MPISSRSLIWRGSQRCQHLGARPPTQHPLVWISSQRERILRLWLGGRLDEERCLASRTDGGVKNLAALCWVRCLRSICPKLQQVRRLADDCLKPFTGRDDGVDPVDALTCIECHSFEVPRH